MAPVASRTDAAATIRKSPEVRAELAIVCEAYQPGPGGGSSSRDAMRRGHVISSDETRDSR